MGLYNKIGLRYISLRIFSFVNLTRYYNLRTATAVTFKQLLSKLTTRKYYMLSIFGQKIRLRKNNTDELIFDQIFSEQQYSYLMHGKEVETIIDAGANIGLAAVFFHHKYPNAKIISIEPDENNFSLLRYNTQNHTNRELLKGALWNKPGFLEISNPEVAPSSFVVKEKTGHAYLQHVKAFTINQIMEWYNINSIDILKIDIEGAEEQLFTGDYKSWLDKTKTLIIELHDQFIPYSSSPFFHAIFSYNFNFEIKGENLIFHFDHS